jgi:predicted N-acetyltransferase YhbS
LVAELDGKLAGHIIYSKSRVTNDARQEWETLTFGPLTVLPEYQGLGIGQALMAHSFAEAKRLGYRAVLIFGHPDYYPRAGFRRAAEFGITTAKGHSFDAFMAYPLYEGALDGVSGRYGDDPVYHTLTQEAALEFDKRFPAKEAFIPSPIALLLDRLEPDARRAIELLGLSSLGMMTTKSQREIAALSGIDPTAIATIRAVTREFGVKWGESIS